MPVCFARIGCGPVDRPVRSENASVLIADDHYHLWTALSINNATADTAPLPLSMSDGYWACRPKQSSRRTQQMSFLQQHLVHSERSSVTRQACATRTSLRDNARAEFRGMRTHLRNGTDLPLSDHWSFSQPTKNAHDSVPVFLHSTPQH